MGGLGPADAGLPVRSTFVEALGLLAVASAVLAAASEEGRYFRWTLPPDSVFSGFFFGWAILKNLRLGRQALESNIDAVIIFSYGSTYFRGK